MRRSAIRRLGAPFRLVGAYIRGVYRRFGEEDILFLSAGIAFNAVLCTIPFLLLVTSALGIFLHSHHLQAQKVDEFLQTIFPLQPYAQKLRAEVKEMLYDIVRYRSAVGIYGFAILVWTATSLFSSIRTAMNRIYRVSVSKRWLVRVGEDVVLVLLAGALFLVANFFTWIQQFLISLLKGMQTAQDLHLIEVVRSVSFAFSYLPALLLFFLINRFIPAGGISSRVALVSSMTTTSLWWIAGVAFGWYLETFHSYSNLYGAYAFLIVSIVWVYYCSIVLVLGMVVGQVFRERSPHSAALQDAPSLGGTIRP